MPSAKFDRKPKTNSLISIETMEKSIIFIAAIDAVAFITAAHFFGFHTETNKERERERKRKRIKKHRSRNKTETQQPTNCFALYEVQ